MKFQQIDTVLIKPSADNVRKASNPVAIVELKKSVEESGILVPLLVRPIKDDEDNYAYEIIAGNRRLTVALDLSLATVPGLILDADEEASQTIQIVENLQREQLHPLDEAEAFHHLAQTSESYAEVGRVLGKPESFIAGRIQLLKLEEEGRRLFTEGVLTLDHATLLSRLTPEDQEKALRWLIQHEDPTVSRYSQEKHDRLLPAAKDVKLFRSWIDAEINLVLSNAPWDKDDPTLVEAAGACITCPMNSGYNRALFPDLQKTDTCTDRACFRSKLDAYRRRMQKASRKADKQDFLLLSETHYLDKSDPLKVDGVKHAGRYKVITEKGRCEFARKGQFIDGKRKGEFVLVCNTGKCPKHWGGPGTRAASSGAAAKDTRHKEEARRQRSNTLFKQTVEARVLTLAAIEIAKRAADPKVQLAYLRNFVRHLNRWVSPEEEKMWAEAGIPGEKEVRRKLDTMEIPELVAAMIQMEGSELDAETLAKPAGINLQRLDHQVRKDLHRCEVCRCSEITACEGGCSWRADLVKAGRYVCSQCTPKEKAASSASEKPKKAAKPAPAAKGKKGGKGK